MSVRRITNELTRLKNDSNSNVSVDTVADEVFHLRATLCGPDDTPYAGGVFIVDMRIPFDYPLKPPECLFTTKIYHPNVTARGQICLDLLKKDWNPGQSIAKVLNALRDLLKNPDAGNALEAEIAHQYRKDRGAFERIAREWTEKYAPST
jgi:ubiquitin-conjugating enzyme E2 D/E